MIILQYFAGADFSREQKRSNQLIEQLVKVFPEFAPLQVATRILRLICFFKKYTANHVIESSIFFPNKRMICYKKRTYFPFAVRCNKNRLAFCRVKMEKGKKKKSIYYGL